MGGLKVTPMVLRKVHQHQVQQLVGAFSEIRMLQLLVVSRSMLGIPHAELYGAMFAKVIAFEKG